MQIWAGDVRSQRPTACAHLCTQGTHTYSPQHGQSQTQSAVAFSIPVAELAAGLAGYKEAIILAMDLWQVLCHDMKPPLLDDDHRAMITAVIPGAAQP